MRLRRELLIVLAFDFCGAEEDLNFRPSGRDIFTTISQASQKP
jgi:hypothetical protein